MAPGPCSHIMWTKSLSFALILDPTQGQHALHAFAAFLQRFVHHEGDAGTDVEIGNGDATRFGITNNLLDHLHCQLS